MKITIETTKYASDLICMIIQQTDDPEVIHRIVTGGDVLFVGIAIKNPAISKKTVNYIIRHHYEERGCGVHKAILNIKSLTSGDIDKLARLYTDYETDLEIVSDSRTRQETIDFLSKKHKKETYICNDIFEAMLKNPITSKYALQNIEDARFAKFDKNLQEAVKNIRIISFSIVKGEEVMLF